MTDLPRSPIRPGGGLDNSPEAEAYRAAAGLNAASAPAEAAAPTPVPVPVPIPGITAPAPAATSPAPTAPQASRPATANSAYTAAGSLTAQQVITGDPNAYRHLDERLEEVIAEVQKELVAMGAVDDLALARFDADLRARLSNDIDRIALKYLMASRSTGGQDNKFLIASAVNEILGLGPLEPLWQDPAISEVIVNGPNEVFVERAGRLMRATGARFRSQAHLLEVCQRILSPLNRKLDVKDPLADGRLPDGSRVNAVHTAIAPKGPLLTIRRFPQVNRSLADLTELGAMSEDIACTLAWLVGNRASILCAGGTGSGKTSLLNALSAAIPRNERVITIEDSLELRLHPDSHVAAMEARPTDASGHNSVTIHALVKNALRMRPDRIVVGEVRGKEALNMLEACNTGHQGSMSTLHANGANEAVSRLAVMVAQGGDMPAEKVDWLVGSALDAIVMVTRYKDGSRRVSGIYEVPEVETLAPGAPLTCIPLWVWKRTGEDADGTLQGHYEKVNDLSEHLREKLGLDFEPKPDFDAVRQLAAY